jgi:hypothetical protein
MKEKRYYAILERVISERVIARCYESTPYPNADGTIDYYRDKMGEWDSLAGIRVDSIEEAEQYLMSTFPTIYREDKTRIRLKEIPENI